jgi:hypothetical protein
MSKLDLTKARAQYGDADVPIARKAQTTASMRLSLDAITRAGVGAPTSRT